MVSSKAAELIAQLDKIDRSSIGSDGADVAAIKHALFAALRRVQTPFDTAFDLCWNNPAGESATRTLLNAGLFDKWLAKGGQPASGHELAAMTGVDPELMERLLRYMAGQHFIEQIDDSTYALTHYSGALADPQLANVITFGFRFQRPVLANFSKFAQDTNYRNPTNLEQSNYQHFYGPGTSVFGSFKDDPELGTSFNDSMRVFALNKTSWTDIYPSDQIVADLREGKPLVIDIGGGVGHDLERFRSRHPDVPHGSLILQDLPAVIQKAEVKAPAITQAHDMFTPEPVKGARVYFLHNILHDWPDDQSAEILRNVAKGMEKGYSRLLLNENVIPAKGAHQDATTLDMIMMMVFSSVERTEEHWRKLIARVPGLKLVKIWTLPEAVESVLELELA